MRLMPKSLPQWPKLAWLAVFQDGSRTIPVYHGPMVEVSEEWVAEAVWAGTFGSGDFDQTDLVFGSGVRCRGGKVVFVTAGTGADRLWYCCHKRNWHVSNSLPALLASTGLSLRDDYDRYTFDIEATA